jgi:hypothetical protein
MGDVANLALRIALVALASPMIADVPAFAQASNRPAIKIPKNIDPEAKADNKRWWRWLGSLAANPNNQEYVDALRRRIGARKPSANVVIETTPPETYEGPRFRLPDVPYDWRLPLGRPGSQKFAEDAGSD